MIFQEMVSLLKTEPWVLYLIVNSSLGMSIGKTAAQVSHGVGILYEEFARINRKYQDNCQFGISIEDENTQNSKILEENFNSFALWKADCHRKVVLQANQEQWEELKIEFTEFIVRDAGFTELKPNTETVIAVWPMLKSKAPDSIKKLKLLK